MTLFGQSWRATIFILTTILFNCSSIEWHDGSDVADEVGNIESGGSCISRIVSTFPHFCNLLIHIVGVVFDLITHVVENCTHTNRINPSQKLVSIVVVVKVVIVVVLFCDVVSLGYVN